MKEIQLRLEIIRMAVELGDHPTINHQVTQLRNQTTDTDLHAILDELQRHNFHQALFAMETYEKRRQEADDFFDTVSEPTPEQEEDNTLMSSEGLFDLEDSEKSDPHVIGVDEMLAMTRESVSDPRTYTPPAEEVSLQSAASPAVSDDVPVTEDSPQEEESELFDLSGADEDVPAVLPDTGSPNKPVAEAAHVEVEKAEETFTDPSLSGEEGLFDLDRQIRSAQPETDENTFVTPEPTAVPDHAETVPPLFPDETDVSETAGNTPEEEVSLFVDETAEEIVPRSADTVFVASDTDGREEPEAEDTASTAAVPEVPDEHEPSPDEPRYEAFAYMGQKFRNMLHQFPQKIPYEEGVYLEAQRFIDRVSTEDYTESQVEAMIARYQELKAEGHLAEAAQVLIAAATTESRFAQFMLARELFKGEVLKPDHAEAFTQINRMAEEDYPEAICDLGQLYEYGIGIDKNKHHALLLYEEAAAMGIERAQRHYERLRRANPLRSITSLFSRR